MPVRPRRSWAARAQASGVMWLGAVFVFILAEARAFCENAVAGVRDTDREVRPSIASMSRRAEAGAVGTLCFCSVFPLRSVLATPHNSSAAMVSKDGPFGPIASFSR
jgi:hypothetical protein